MDQPDIREKIIGLLTAHDPACDALLRVSVQSMQARCESDKESLQLFRRLAASTVRTYFRCHPGRDTLPCNEDLHEDALEVLSRDVMSYNKINQVLIAVESRLSMMDLADQFLSIVGLSHPVISCRTLDLQRWERDRARDYKHYGDILTMILEADFFPRTPTDQQGKRFLKPQGYIAAVLCVAGRDVEGAILDLDTIQEFAKRHLEGTITIF